MAKVDGLLVAAPMLQDYLVDKTTGTPLAGGKIFLYQDTSRTTFKDWFYQTGTPGNYTYPTLDNPLTLSSVGTIQDPNGNDVIPFFYPFDENNANIVQTYFIQVYSTLSDGSIALLQFTRENFPFTPETGTDTLFNPTLQNILVNGEFWRNGGTGITLTNVNSTDNPNGVTVCPSQHQSLSMPDIRFFKDVGGATDTISFSTFQTDNVLQNDLTPEYYLNLTCASSGSGELVKYIQIPISTHIKTLSNVKGTVTIQAQNFTGAAGTTLIVKVLQFTGTGAVVPSPSPFVYPASTLNLKNNWDKFEIPVIFPSSTGLTPSDLGPGEDDALYLQIYYPVGQPININIAKPSLYLSATVPENDFSTYDVDESVFNSARTGDVRISLNAFNPYGWVAANDGSIGTVSSAATNRANPDTWPLYNLIWDSVLDNWAPTQDNTGTPVARGTTAIADFKANKRLVLTRTLGRVLAGANPLTITGQAFTTNYAASQTNLTVTSNALFPIGTPVQLTTTASLPNRLSVNTVYYAKPDAATTIQLFRVLEYAYVQPTQVFTADFTTNTLLVSDTSKYFVGQEVQVSNTGGALPSGLTAGTVYYITNFARGVSTQLAANYADAVAGFPVVPLVDNGSGINSIFISPIDIGSDGKGTVQTALGSWQGTDQYILQGNDLAAHIHTNPQNGQFVIDGGGTIVVGAGVGSLTRNNQTGPALETGAPTIMGTLNNPISLLQPMTMMNIFLKL